MGSFNATCIVSNLPIEAGTPVRFLLLAKSVVNNDAGLVCYVGGRWQVYGVPIRAQYNDYGSVEDLKDSPTNRMFFEGLRRMSVEKGVGDNQAHDVQVRPDMTQKQWLEALREGRVEVEDNRPLRSQPDKDWTPPEPKEGIPTLKRVEKLLTDAGHKVTTTYGGKDFVLDSPVFGYVRIRGTRHKPDPKMLEQAVKSLGGHYAAMVTVGTGNYADSAEVLVAPLPDKGVHLHGLGPKEPGFYDPRVISQAMVREDVWQILREMEIQSYRGTHTFERLQEIANQAVDKELARRTALKGVPSGQEAQSLIRDFRSDYSTDPASFSYYLQGHEGTSGFTFKEAYRLALEFLTDPVELRAYMQDLAELVHVQWAYAFLHGQWHPTTNSGQEANWDEHRAFLLKLAALKGQWEDEEDDLDEE